MPRKSSRKPKGKKKESEGTTYYKAKNGRFYKKIQVEGKTRVRFVSNAEATGALKLSKPKSEKPKRTRRKKTQLQKPEPEPVESDEKSE